MTKTFGKFKKIGIKVQEELRTQGTHYLYTLVEFEPEKWLSSKRGKSDKSESEDMKWHVLTKHCWNFATITFQRHFNDYSA